MWQRDKATDGYLANWTQETIFHSMYQNLSAFKAMIKRNSFWRMTHNFTFNIYKFCDYHTFEVDLTLHNDLPRKRHWLRSSS